MKLRGSLKKSLTVLPLYIWIPIVNDAATKHQRKITSSIVKEIDPRLTIHDFRMVDENGSKKVAF